MDDVEELEEDNLEDVEELVDNSTEVEIHNDDGTSPKSHELSQDPLTTPSPPEPPNLLADLLPINGLQSETNFVDTNWNLENNPSMLPTEGSWIQYLDPDNDNIVKAKILQVNPTTSRKWPGWRSALIYPEKVKNGLNLDDF